MNEIENEALCVCLVTLLQRITFVTTVSQNSPKGNG